MAATRVRLLFNSVSDNANMLIAEITMLNSIGTNEITNTGGTVSASSYLSSFTPSNTIDGNASTFWLVLLVEDVTWWEFEFDSAVTITDYEISVRDALDTDASPIRWVYQEHDGSDWVTKAKITTDDDWALGETRSFSTSEPINTTDNHRYWQIACADSLDVSTLAVGELELRTSIGGAQAATGGFAVETALYATYYAYKAFNGIYSTSDEADCWLVLGQVGSFGYNFGLGNDLEIVEVAIFPRYGSFYTSAPINVDLQYSDNGWDWTTKIEYHGNTYTADTLEVLVATGGPGDGPSAPSLGRMGIDILRIGI